MLPTPSVVAAAVEGPWRPEDVVARAKELIHASNYEKVTEARKSIDDTLAAWTTTATAQVPPSETMNAAVITLWGLYAGLEMELRQFKQATKVFEGAVVCPIAGTSPVLWLQYAAFCVDRKKFSNARKVFVRALRVVPTAQQGELWMRFHAFVQAHIEPTMSLAALQAQVFPDRPPVDVAALLAAAPASASTTGGGDKQAVGPEPKEPSTMPAPSSEMPSTTATTVPAVASPPKATPTAVNQIIETPIVVDPALAFVDKTGSVDTMAGTTGQKRATDAASAQPEAAKRLRTDQRSDAAPTAVEEDVELQAMLHIPTTLPVTKLCPNLLFDPMETREEVPNELLERLSDVLGDSAVFEGVKDLCDNQRQRDRDMLYRWQDLVGMQMKEGSELFARHMELEQGVNEPRELIALKTSHLEQRREFVNRCRMSQEQFIEICEMDRVNALKAQQISLENMKIPEMAVSSDPKTITLQRAIVGLILEAEKLCREEASTTTPMKPEIQKTTTTTSAKAQKAPTPVSTKGEFRSRSDSRDRDPRDRDHFHRHSGRGGRGGRGRSGGFDRFDRRGPGPRRQFSPPRGGGGGRGMPKRGDVYAPAHHADPQMAYDHVPRQAPPSYQGGHAAAAPRPMQVPNRDAPAPAYGSYGGRDRNGDFGRHQARPAQQQPYGGPVQNWQQPPPQAQHQDRYGGPPVMHSTAAPPQGRYYGADADRHPGSGPGPHQGGRGGRGQLPPSGQGGGYSGGRGDRFGGGVPRGGYAAGGAPPARYGGEPTMGPPQYNAPPPSAYDYAPPQSAMAPPYGYQNAPPPQRQHQQHPPQQPQQQPHSYAPMNQGYQPPPQHLQQRSPPRGGFGGGGEYRRGGRGGYMRR